MPPPHPFAAETYAAWHKVRFPEDDRLREQLVNLRDDLKLNARVQLTALARILFYAITYSSNEYKQARKTPTEYYISLMDALNTDSAEYDLLFKSVPSIVNKLWRKNNKADPDACLANLRERITDLVRTDITATTLDSVVFLADRMNALPAIIYEPKIRRIYDELIESIRFEPEMKMESGYFAYHGLVRFKNGLIVEVQIYSELTKQWRRLSHTLYDRARIEPIETHEFNSTESRLISLGHLLHLAECQLHELGKEFGAH